MLILLLYFQVFDLTVFTYRLLDVLCISDNANQVFEVITQTETFLTGNFPQQRFHLVIIQLLYLLFFLFRLQSTLPHCFLKIVDLNSCNSIKLKTICNMFKLQSPQIFRYLALCTTVGGTNIVFSVLLYSFFFLYNLNSLSHREIILKREDSHWLGCKHLKL